MNSVILPPIALNTLLKLFPSGEKVFATNEYYYSLLNNNNSPVMIQFVSKETEDVNGVPTLVPFIYNVNVVPLRTKAT